ncbi:MAG: hypothetical protein AAFR61_10285 [Bacteroidota bacterium]
MDGIRLIRDEAGKLLEIRVDAVNHPELAEDVYHLIHAVKRAKETERAVTYKQSITVAQKRKSPMSLAAFNRLIKEAKASGELSESEFFQQLPQWRKKEKSSSLS